MKCDHCGSGDSHYDYAEILKIESRNLELMQEIEEKRNEIAKLKKERKINLSKFFGYISIIIFFLAALTITILSFVFSWGMGVSGPLICVSLFSGFLLFFLFLHALDIV